MHGAGNDYIYVNCFEEHVGDPAALAVRLSDRHFGVGGDGVILVMPSDVADVRMRIFNADGSEAEMCGNGIRCVGKYAYEHGLAGKNARRADGAHLDTGSAPIGRERVDYDEDVGAQSVPGAKHAGAWPGGGGPLTDICVESASGVKRLGLHVSGGKVESVTVDMGKPVCPDTFPETISIAGIGQPEGAAKGVDLGFVAVDMGNPHAVYFIRKPAADADGSFGVLTGGRGIDALDLDRIGPAFERHPRFPDRTNSEFVEVVDRGHIRMRVYERGSAETLACGTGACAAVVASVLMGYTDREVEVALRGGTLSIRWDEATGTVYMTGPAVEVFTGEVAV